MKNTKLANLSIILFCLSFSSLDAGITRISISNLIGFRTYDAERQTSTNDPLWIPLATEQTSSTGSNYEVLRRKSSQHYASWGNAFGYAGYTSEKTVTEDNGSDLTTFNDTSVRIQLSDDLFFTRPANPESDEKIAVTLKFDADYLIPNSGYEKFGRVQFSGGFGLPATVKLATSSDSVSGSFEYNNDGENPLEISGFGIQEYTLMVDPGQEATLTYLIEIEHSVGYFLYDPMIGDALNVGGGIYGGLRVWVEVDDGIELTTDSGHDYRVEPAVVDLDAGQWGGFPLDVDGWVNTGDVVGWVNVQKAPWIYTLAFDKYIYLPEGNLLNDNGFWLYNPK